MSVQLNMVREYFYPEVREAGDGEFYPRWWGVVDIDTYVSAMKSRYNIDVEFEEDVDDTYARPTHMIISTHVPLGVGEDDKGIPYQDNVHGNIFPVVIDDGAVRAWAGYTVDECLGGGPDLQDEDYNLAKQWVIGFNVSELVTEEVPGLPPCDCRELEGTDDEFYSNHGSCKWCYYM